MMKGYPLLTTPWTDPGPMDPTAPAETWAAARLPAGAIPPHALIAGANAALTTILTAHQAATGGGPTLHQLFDYLCTPEVS